MEAARLEAERATAKSSAEQLRGLEHAMRGDREQKLQLIDRYTQEAAELEKTLQAEQDKLAGQDAAAQARQEELQAALAERAKVEARKTATEKEVQEKNRDILNMERESARLESRKNAAELEEKQILDRLWDTYELTRSSAPPLRRSWRARLPERSAPRSSARRSPASARRTSAPSTNLPA